MKSTSGYCLTLGSGIFSWSSKKQEMVAQSIAEVEFVAATAAKDGTVTLVYCKTEEQIADVFTKLLPAIKFEDMRSKFGVCSS
ncbi:hypothetical protein KIW84_056241 [Lathyrus oleraceus]|uniref:Uncharacterized protein n=1 Tax=Pisum sativum TaxID=3888 RepID=A0A9D5AGN7_PEA|nr:hypothetical protein KIW84_056241 [Pisum sativum]